jgi:hypothetical protein
MAATGVKYRAATAGGETAECPGVLPPFARVPLNHRIEPAEMPIAGTDIGIFEKALESSTPPRDIMPPRTPKLAGFTTHLAGRPPCVLCRLGKLLRNEPQCKAQCPRHQLALLLPRPARRRWAASYAGCRSWIRYHRLRCRDTVILRRPFFHPAICGPQSAHTMGPETRDRSHENAQKGILAIVLGALGRVCREGGVA